MMRQIKTERGLLTRADGSARWEQGEHATRNETEKKSPSPAERHRFFFVSLLPIQTPRPSLTSTVSYAPPTDGSVVLAAVYGPRTIQARKENTEQLTIEVNYRPASGVQSE